MRADTNSKSQAREETERLAKECARLDPREEQTLAKEWLIAEVDWSTN